MSDKKLTNEIVLRVWNKLPKPSLQAVKEETGRLGYINPATGKPYSRQWVRVLMSETPEGRQKLGRPTNSSSLRERVLPVIVEDRPEYLNWYINNGFVGYPIIAPNKVTVTSIDHRYVYGDLSVSLARHARSVWIPEIIEGKCHLKEYKVRTIK